MGTVLIGAGIEPCGADERVTQSSRPEYRATVHGLQQRMRRLHNEDWGFETNCFVCEPKNELGLQLPFHHDPDNDVVVADFELSDAHSGAPGIAHGGIILAIADEAMAWAVIASAKRLAMTASTQTNFVEPVWVGGRHRVTASVTSLDGSTIETEATIERDGGGVCARTTATFVALSDDKLESLAGQAVDVPDSW